MKRVLLSKKLFIVVMILAGVACLPTPASAISVEAYKAKVEKARLLAIEVENSLKANEVNHSQTRAFVEHVRENFPAAERVDSPGGGVETTNGWLLEKNTAFENETDLKKRLSLVVGIREYLSAVAFKLEELESASAATRTKDEDKQKLGEILRREEYQKPKAKEETAFETWLQRFLEWLESLFITPKPSQGAPGFGGLAFLLQIVLYAGLFALLAFLVYKIIPLIVPHARRARKSKKKERIILGEKIAENETAADLMADAERLAREGNLREAIRKGYIALLCELSDRKILGLARHKTNRDYLRDVRSRRDLHPRMKVVTDTFERHWYGFQRSDEVDWAEFRNEYDRAIRSV